MINKRILLLLAIPILCTGILIYAQAPKAEKKKVPSELQDKINVAILSGTTYLSSYLSMDKLPETEITDYEGYKHTLRYADLILYTLANCGIAGNENWSPFIKRCTDMRLDRTYHVALQAMALEHIDRVRYQQRIADCGQFLIDNQCKNGQWSYGSERGSPRWIKSGADKVIITGKDKSDNPDDKEKPKEAPPKKPEDSISTQSKQYQPIKLSGGPQGPKGGDNSNSQYAILGIRACIESNISGFDNSLQMAKKWFSSCQEKDGSWGYCGAGVFPSSPGYGSMTMGAMGSLCITYYYLKDGRLIDKEGWYKNAMKWLLSNYTVKENPKSSGVGREWNYYYLYAIERFGMLADLEKFGDKDWYLDGATHLLEVQSNSGKWNGNIYDTCFALLFLTKATKPLKIVTTGN